MTDPDYTVTLYKLFLGDQSTTPPYHFQIGYTIHSIVAPVFPRGTFVNTGNLVYYTQYDFTGFTEYDVNEGDVTLDKFNRYYEIKSMKPWTNGDQFAFYELEVEEKPVFPFLAGFFGFEDAEHFVPTPEHSTGAFEDGFERGYWAL